MISEVDEKNNRIYFHRMTSEDMYEMLISLELQMDETLRWSISQKVIYCDSEEIMFEILMRLS